MALPATSVVTHHQQSLSHACQSQSRDGSSDLVLACCIPSAGYTSLAESSSVEYLLQCHQQP